MPTLVDPIVQMSATAQNTNDASALTLRFPHPISSANCILVGFQCGAAVTATITDDTPGGSNTYTQRAAEVTTQHLYLFEAHNVTAGGRTITITFNTFPTNYYSAFAVELYNIDTSAPYHVGATSTGSGTAIDGGTLTTTVDNCFLLMFTVQTADNPGTHAGTSMTPGAGWTPVYNDLSCGTYAQWMQQFLQGAIVPTSTMAPGTLWSSVSIALKTATAGTARPAASSEASGVRIRGRQCHSVLITPSVTQPFRLQVPCRPGSTIISRSVSANSNASDHSISRIIDSAANTWRLDKKNPNGYGGNRGDTEIWSARNVIVPPEGQLTLQYFFTNAVSEIVLDYLEVIGLDGNPTPGATYETVGNQPNSGDLTAGIITPATPSGLVVSVTPVDIGAITGLVGSTYLFDAATFPEGAGGFNTLEEDNGRGHVFVISAAQLTFVWTNTNSGGVGAGVGDWANVSVHYPAGAPGIRVKLLNQGPRPNPFSMGNAR
jgi:hypothetical protein